MNENELTRPEVHGIEKVRVSNYTQPKPYTDFEAIGKVAIQRILPERQCSRFDNYFPYQLTRSISVLFFNSVVIRLQRIIF